MTQEWRDKIHFHPARSALSCSKGLGYNAIHWINLYPVDSATGFLNTYPQDSDLSGGIYAGSCPGFEPGLMG